MATYKSGNLIKLYLRPNGSTTAFGYIVCNEDLALNGTGNEITRSTKCGVLKDNGEISFEIPFSGVADIAPGGGTLSHNQLYDWFVAKTSLDFVFGDASSGGAVLDFSGVGVLTALNIQAPVDDFVGFDGTLSVTGNPTNNF